MHRDRKLQAVMVRSVAAAVLCICPALAQSTLPKYDVKTEAKLTGTVEELKLPANGSRKQAAYLLLKNGADMVDVYLCPESFLKDMGFTFSKDDEVALIGSKVKQEHGELVLAREIVRGTDTLVLRDDKGGPVWNWH